MMSERLERRANDTEGYGAHCKQVEGEIESSGVLYRADDDLRARKRVKKKQSNI